MILCTETLKVAEITPHVSPVRTMYSKGGNGVSVGISVEVGCSVAVGVIVAVVVGDTSAVGSAKLPPMPACKLK